MTWPVFDDDGDVIVSGWVDKTYLPSRDEIRHAIAEIRAARGTVETARTIRQAELRGDDRPKPPHPLVRILRDVCRELELPTDAR